MSRFPMNPVCGETGLFFSPPSAVSGLNIAQPPHAGVVALGPGVQAPNDFESLARVVRSNERLFEELGALGVNLGRARAYLTEPVCHRHLADANVSHLKTRRSGILALMRANRLEAWEILARIGTEGAREVALLQALSARRAGHATGGARSSAP
jgi:hypothetical protein